MTRNRPHKRRRQDASSKTPKIAAPVLHPPVATPTPAWALWLVGAIAATALVLAVSFQIFDTDLWMHLARAKAMVALGSIPQQQIWTWPTYGQPETNASWGFALEIWPFWTLGGETGLFVWRWLSILTAAGVSWLTARRLGARGLVALVAIVMCLLVYRQRAQVRPESLTMVLLALELLILEMRRQKGRDLAWLVVPIAWLWPNVHPTYYLGWIVLGAFTAEEWIRNRGPQRPAKEARPRISLAWIFLASIAISFVNPFGASALWVPVQHMLQHRGEPLYQAIGELMSIEWSVNWRNGLPLLMVGWPLLQLWRWRRGRPDRVEALLWLVFTAGALGAQRVLTYWAMLAAPYVARGLSEWIETRRLPRWTRSPALRAATAGLAIVALTVVECARPGFRFGFGIQPNSYPGAACDFIDSVGVRGRAFNYFEHGGYLLWRFWPDSTRLPFMTTAPELATAEMRMDYSRSMVLPGEWPRMAARWRFDWVLLRCQRDPADQYLDFLDADTTFALVFADDVAALYVRRAGPLAPIAERYGYEWFARGYQKLNQMTAASQEQILRYRIRRELNRAIQSSPQHAGAASLLASVEMMDANWNAAKRALEDARRIEPQTPQYHQRMGDIAAEEGDDARALRSYEAECRVRETAEIDVRLALVNRKLGNLGPAASHLERALRLGLATPGATDTLEAWKQAR